MMKLGRLGALGLVAALAMGPVAAPALGEELKADKKAGPSVGGVAGGAGGVVKGVVAYTGKTPERKPITDLATNPFCKAAHEGPLPLRDTFIFGKNGEKTTLANALVYVSKGLEGKKFDAPKTPVVLDQKACIYTPHVVGVVAGQAVDILNSDNTLHNVQASPKNNPAFNDGMPVPMKITKTFEKAEIDINVRCAVHPWMGAWIHVLPHPYFAVSAEDGSFEIQGLPAGEYEVRVIHEMVIFNAESVKVKVEDGKEAKADFEVKADKEKRREAGVM
jgi:plastocyanin